jgi:DNA-binding transcriptional LysR family regulator
VSRIGVDIGISSLGQAWGVKDPYRYFVDFPGEDGYTDTNRPRFGNIAVSGRLDDWSYFVHAVEAGGFTAAGRRLGCPKTTVSKRVAALEARLGVQLLVRNSRRFALTDAGREVFDHARAAMIEVEAAEEAVLRRRAEPAGLVRITASVPVAQERLSHLLPALAQRYPRLQVWLHVSDRVVDLVRDGFDIAIRSHFAPLPDSGLVARRMNEDPVWLAAAPGYLERHGMPEAPEDLARHDGLLVNPDVPAWVLAHAGGGTVEVRPRPRFFADESTVLLGAATAGLGIVAMPRWMLRTALADGRLVQVLPGWHAGTVTTTVLTTHRRGQLPAVRAVVEALCEPQ